MTPSAFVFDLDGTVLDTNRVNFEIWTELLAERGYEFSEELFLRFTGRKRTETEKILQQQYGKDFPFQELLQIRIQRARVRSERTGMPIKKGAKELIESVYAKGYPIGLVTSTPRKEAGELLDKAGLWQYFFAAVGGDEVVNGKPSGEGYLLCAERLGCVPSQCLAFEDTDLGVQAAVNAGMKVIMVPDLKPASEEDKRIAWAVLDGLDEVERFMGVCWG